MVELGVVRTAEDELGGELLHDPSLFDGGYGPGAYFDHAMYKDDQRSQT